MFNLEKAIADWRKQLKASGLVTPEVLDELESHLRDEVATQSRAGRDDARAFATAAAQMGQAASIKSEFSKLSSSSGNRLRILLGIFCALAAPLMLLLVAWSIWNEEADRSGRVIGLIIVSVIACYVAALPFIYRYLPDPSRPRVRTLLKIMNVLFCSWTILELLGALQIVQVQIGNYFSMIGRALYTAYACSVLAYACRGSSLDPIANGASDPSSDQLTELAQSGLARARQEAVRLNHDFIGTEHLLLGIIGTESGLLMDILRKHSVTYETLREASERQIPKCLSGDGTEEIEFTPRAKRAMRFAAEQAVSMNHSHIHAEHIFLGLLLEDKGIGGVILRKLGFKFRNVRAEILRRFGPGDEGEAEVVPT